MQLLLNIACKLPALLEKYNDIGDLLDAVNFDAVECLSNDFHGILTSLQEWEHNLQVQSSHPLVWSKREPNVSSSSSKNSLWFPNMMVANSLTHYWALEIVIRMHLSTLDVIISTAKGHGPQTHMGTSNETVKGKSLLTLADLICDSISYFLQPKMKLHGLVSALFTLPTALRAYGREQNLSSSRLSRCQQMTDLLASRGVHFAID
jgi:hypothetical protein